MDAFLDHLATLRDLALFLLGFGFIVFVHELGHFLAARWAGIRVLAFAIGFGPAVCSFRKGLGFRWGSSDKEYQDRLRSDASAPAASAISPTEYRFNWLPLGGYVKMLGQEDLNPNAISAAPDSYQSTPPWKRMVVISAGVVMNLIFAALAFVFVFMVGLKTEPAWIGNVDPAYPAASAVASNAADLGVTEPGLHPGDKVLTINGQPARKFMDLALATAMSKKGTPVALDVQRPGIPSPLHFQIVPTRDRVSGMLSLGVEPARSANVSTLKRARDRQEFARAMDRLKLRGVEPGMTLRRAGDRAVASTMDVNAAFAASNGKPVALEFVDPSGKAITIDATPTPATQRSLIEVAKDRVVPLDHVLGLTPVMKIAEAPADENARAKQQGLHDGDVFVRIGSIEYPSITQGMSEIQAHKGKTIPIVVARRGSDGATREVALDVEVSPAGTIGFLAADTGSDSTLIALPQARLASMRADEPPKPPPAAGVFTTPGSRILSINGTSVSNFQMVREALRSAAILAGNSPTTLDVVVALPQAGQDPYRKDAPRQTIEWTLAADDLRTLRSLGWESPLPPMLFDPVESILKGNSPAEAISLGISETHDVMMNTYLTFARLFEGTVKVQHLKGPVGIAHMGTIVAERGLIWLLFFLALISVNLAVINFLPLPIVDGGQFLLLVWEAAREKPAPISVQNGLTLAGLVLIGCVFLIVTFNDIRTLIGI